VNITKQNKCKLELNFEVSQEDVRSETDKVYQELQQNAKISGFRVGKVPMEIIKQHYKDVVRDKVVENLLKDTIYSTLKEKNINPVDIPQVEKIDFDFTKPFKFNVIVEQHPEITTKEYKGMKLLKEIKKVTEKDVEKALSELQKYNTKLVESKSDIVTKDNYIIVSYSVYDEEDKELLDLKTENQLIDVSSKYLLPGINENVIGMKKGESKLISTKLSKDFPDKNYAEKNVKINLKVLSIKEKVLPELNDNFAKDLGYPDMNTLRQKIIVSLENENLKLADEKLEQQIIDNLLKANPITDLPDSLIEKQKQFLINQMRERYKNEGFNNDFIEKQIEALKDKIVEESIKQLKLSYILASIEQQENITVSDEEINQIKQVIIKVNPNKEKFIWRQFSDEEFIDKLTSQLKTDKIFKLIKDNADIKVEYN